MAEVVGAAGTTAVYPTALAPSRPRSRTKPSMRRAPRARPETEQGDAKEERGGGGWLSRPRLADHHL